jgi:hypothetical protein
MMSIRKIVTAAAVALGVAGGSQAFAWGDGGCKGPFCNQPRYPTLMAFMGHGHGNLPTFQAAPWYLYWPYDAHFLTPAPVRAPFYAPPGGGNFPVNPYFPAPAGYYGPIPGGPAPAGVPAPPGFGPVPPGGYPVPGTGYPAPGGSYPVPGGPGAPITYPVPGGSPVTPGLPK